MSSDSQLAVGVVLDGRYRLAEQLGEGSMGVVYRAEIVDSPMASPVAVKLLHDQWMGDEKHKERFMREARVLFGLKHPHIVKVSDFGLYDGRPYLAMELLQGVSLEHLLEERTLDMDEALRLSRDILAALSYAHDTGAMHRDLKAENVFVVTDDTGKRRAKLLDFGLVKFLDPVRWGRGQALTNTGDVFGTPAYMPPEQWLGAPVDQRADVYTMGVVMYELITGEWPFITDSRSALMRAHIERPLPDLVAKSGESVPPKVEAIIRKAAEKNPNDRYNSATDMLEALDAVRTRPRETSSLPNAHPSAAPPGMPGTSRAKGNVGGGSTKRTLLIGTVVVVAAVAAVVVLLVLR